MHGLLHPGSVLPASRRYKVKSIRDPTSRPKQASSRGTRPGSRGSRSNRSEPNKAFGLSVIREIDVSISEPLIVPIYSEPSGMPDKLFVRSSSHFPTCEGTSGFRKKALPQEVGLRTVLVSHQVFWKAGRNSIHPHPRVLKYLPARIGGDTSSYPEPRAEYGIEIP